MHLVVTQADDPHAHIVESGLRDRGATCLRLNPAQIPGRGGVSMTFDGPQRKILLRLNGDAIDADRIGTVWWRRPEAPSAPAGLDRGTRLLLEAETASALEALWIALRDRFWVNCRTSYRAARCKPHQLRIAARVGLMIPRTTVTNRPDEVRDFFRYCDGRVVYKACEPTSRTTADGRVAALYTTAVIAEHLESHLPSLTLAPGIFQEYVPKQAEIRVTVIGREVFAVETPTEDAWPASCDGRRRAAHVQWRPCRLPHPVAERVLRVCHELNLVFGCVDLVKRPDGEIVFLEVNPSGQWYWVEQQTGMPLVQAFLDLLMRGSRTGATH